MKKLLLIFSLSLLGSSFSFGQTTIQEQYFHELKGMEDSSGVTHLFYKMYDRYKDELTCSDNGFTYTRLDRNIFHLDTSTNQDSILFEQYSTYSCSLSEYYNSIFDFTFIDQDPEKWIKGVVFNSKYSIKDYRGHEIEFYLPVPTKSKATYQEYFPKSFFLDNSEDSFFVNTEFAGTLKFPDNENNWPTFNDYNEYKNYTDSVIIGWDIIAQHPFFDSLYYARGVEYNESSLYISKNSLENFTQTNFDSFSNTLKFDDNNSHVYSLTSSGILRSDNLGEKDSWELIGIDFQTSASKFLALDQSTSGNLFISDSTNILFSKNYGDTFTSLISLDDEVSGLYKKPDSNLLYALTRKELLEINTETKSVVSLKQLSVSNEPRPGDIPKQVTLQQNYPNPFNPSTVISYQLSENSLVRIEVFDVSGRKVAVLVDGERKATGTHQVTFSAGNLASGVYFYRLETGGQTLTQKMLLVK